MKSFALQSICAGQPTWRYAATQMTVTDGSSAYCTCPASAFFVKVDYFRFARDSSTIARMTRLAESEV